MTSRHLLVSHRAALATATTVALLCAAPPAGAHVGVTAEGAQAGAGPVTLVFGAESESPGTGIVGIATRLPAGIAPADVALAGGPAGWVLTPTPDGFELAGPDIGPGVDAGYSITVARLPEDTTELVFPTLQRYADGREDAWIEPVTEAVPEPAGPAPVLVVAAAPAGTVASSSTPTPPPSPSGDATPPAPATQAGATARSDAADPGSGAAVLVGGIAALALAGAGLWGLRRRRVGGSRDSPRS